MTRLPVETFDIPAAEIRRGYRSAIYFNRAKTVATGDPERDARGVVMQVFQKTPGAVLCGIDEAIAILRIGAGRWKDEREAQLLFDEYIAVKLRSRGAGRDARYANLKRLLQLEDTLDDEWISEFDELEVSALHDGDIIDPWEPVLRIKGRYSSFAHLESVYLGVLARRTKVATNTRRVVEAARGKPVLFFADRFDHFGNQGGDGYAAHIGGATGMASDAMAAWWGEKGMGTMPHALIAFYEGDTVRACFEYRRHFPDTNLIALTDFNNNTVVEGVHVLRVFEDHLYGVRLDTSENMVDHWFEGRADSLSISEKEDGYYPRMGDFKPTGVNAQLVRENRRVLDVNNGQHVKITVSGGFNPDKINSFENEGVPVDIYAVGSSLLAGSNDFTADVVVPVGKEGRWERKSDRLERVE